MNFFKNKTFVKVLIIHFIIILFLFLFSSLKGCFKTTSPEIITYVNFENPESYVDPNNVKNTSLESVSKNPIESKPKWKPTPVSEIKKGKRIEKVEVQNSEKVQKIQQALNNIKSEKNTDHAKYLLSIRSLVFENWSPPIFIENISKYPIIRLIINKQGKILDRKTMVLSGNEMYDDSVVDAVNAITSVPNPPRTYQYNYIEIHFGDEK